MRVCVVHNHYLQPGGEDEVFRTEAGLLERYGHDVLRYTVHNDIVREVHPLVLAGKTVWNPQSYWGLRALIRRRQPDVVHVHNTFPLLSPAIYHAARAERVPVIQTLHNYRLLCPGATFFRHGRPCQECLRSRVPWLSLRYACYRESRAATGAVVAMLVAHRWLRTWERHVDLYVALSEFARQKFIEGGLPADRIVVKPNCVNPDPRPGDGSGRCALFVGRLSPEKGVATLLVAWRWLGGKVPLKVVGDGPLAPEMARAVAGATGIEWLGRQSPEEVYALMGEASFLVVPSECYETFGRVVVEAFAKGTPVLVSDIGSLAELVEDGRTGLRFRPGDPDDLAAKVEWMLGHPDRVATMRREARAEYEAKYTAEENYRRLMAIYELAIGTARG